ncbi:MAG: PAS domain S-box protein [Deltaproteobacteria bacterium]|nr:PAS domain S-box protein [Deltaproteobacteria bacterium]
MTRRSPLSSKQATTDGTEVKTKEQALNDSEPRFRTLIEHAADAIYVHDAAGVITDINPQACNNLGYSRDELIGRPLTDIDQQVEPERVRHSLLQLESGAPIVVDTVHRRKDGSTFPVEIRSVRFMWNGQPHVLGMCRDVTERKQMEQALREARASLDLAAAAARVGLWDWDLQTGKTHYANSWRALFGYSATELDGSLEEWVTLVHPDDVEALTRNTRAAIEANTSVYEEEFRLRHKDGTYRWVLSRASVLVDDACRPARMLGAHVDIDAQKQAEDAARRSARQLQVLFEASVDVIGIMETDGTFRDVSPSIRSLLGYQVSELVGRNGFDFVHQDDRAALQTALTRRIAQTGDRTPEECRLQRADGSWVDVESTMSNLLDDPDVRGLVTITRDITARKQALAARLLDVREAESARIAREIHDLLGQGLTALRMDAAWLETRLAARQDGCPDQHVLDRLRAMAGLIEANLATVRRIATELRPPILDDLGLVPAIEWQAEEFEARSGIRCEFRAWPGIPALDPNRSIVVLRVLQEALTNVARHAGATRVVIHVSTEGGCLRLQVRDNGKGVHEHQINAAESLGLRSMRERASLVGGSVVIKGAPGRGTTVALQVPEGQSSLPVPAPREGTRGPRDTFGTE